MKPLDEVIRIIFVISAACVIYVYAVYPLVLWLLARAFGRAPQVRAAAEASALPSISLLIVAHNEEAVIERRLQNAAALDYPAEQIEIVVASDGSTDHTAQLVRRFAEQSGNCRIRLLDYSQRRGKAAVLNVAMAELAGEIVLLSDANTLTDADAARKLVQWFADPAVGAVCGRLVLTDARTGRNADGLYWKYETFLKTCESRLGALLGSNGAIYAIRRELFCPIPDSTIVDDFVIPLLARLRSGCRIIYDREAVAREQTAPDVGCEFHRRCRIGAGDFQAMGLLWRLLDPRQGWIAFTFLSHKILRWVCPFALVALLVANLLLCEHLCYRTLLCGQSLFYLLAGAGAGTSSPAPLARFLRLLCMFVAMNAALLIGFFRWWHGGLNGMWNRTQRVVEGTNADVSRPDVHTLTAEPME